MKRLHHLAFVFPLSQRLPSPIGNIKVWHKYFPRLLFCLCTQFCVTGDCICLPFVSLFCLFRLQYIGLLRPRKKETGWGLHGGWGKGKVGEKFSPERVTQIWPTNICRKYENLMAYVINLTTSLGQD